MKQFVEPLVTKSKEDTTHSRRIVFSYLKQKEAVTELFRTIAPKIADRPGGYTRILKTGFRLGDAADMCIIEFVDFNEAYTLGILPTAAEAKPKTRRSRGKKAADAAAEAAPALSLIHIYYEPVPSGTRRIRLRKHIPLPCVCDDHHDRRHHVHHVVGRKDHRQGYR